MYLYLYPTSGNHFRHLPTEPSRGNITKLHSFRFVFHRRLTPWKSANQPTASLWSRFLSRQYDVTSLSSLWRSKLIIKWSNRKAGGMCFFFSCLPTLDWAIGPWKIMSNVLGLWSTHWGDFFWGQPIAGAKIWHQRSQGFKGPQNESNTSHTVIHRDTVDVLISKHTHGTCIFQGCSCIAHILTYNTKQRQMVTSKQFPMLWDDWRHFCSLAIAPNHFAPTELE